MLTSYSIKNIYSHFEYRELTKITGEPTLDSILLLNRQIKRNAQSVPTTLGGGQLGYLALVITQEKYDAIPNSSPFQRPTDPGRFEVHLPTTATTTSTAVQTPTAPTRRTTRSVTRAATPSLPDPAEPPPTQPTVIFSAEVATQKATHDDALRKFYECQAVEQALRTQIIEAIDSEYLDALRHVDTDMINETIPEIFDFLQLNYGRITEEELVQKEDDLRNYDYDPLKPVDKVFTQIALFQDLCAITNNDKTDRQLCQIGYLIFNRTRAFVDALKKWNATATADKTFAKFKKHMREEHHALKLVGALSIQESSFHQANMIQQVLTQQSDLQDNLQTTIDQQVKDSLFTALSEYSNTMEPPQQDVINHVTAQTNDTSTTALLHLIEKLTQKVDALSSTSRTPDVNPKTGKKFKRYCWSCGCCTHWGKDCNNKKQGHQDSANFKNRMGGSNRNCLPARE